MKRCTKCGEEKELGEFKQARDRKSGFSSWCKSCHAASSRNYYKENKEAIKTRTGIAQKKRHLKNPEKVRAAWRRYQENGNRFVQALTRSRTQSKRYGYLPCKATPEELEIAFMGRCEICGVPEIECTRKLALDHNHDDGSFRGWLCGNCNKMLGHARDNEEILINALHYLMSRQHQEQ